MYRFHFSLVVVMGIDTFQWITQQAGMKKTGSEMNHVTGLAAVHAVAGGPEPVTLGSLLCSDGSFDLRKQIHWSHRASPL